jgi:hypothetical protein
MFQRRSPEGLPDWIGELVKWAILAMVFLGPIAKSLIETFKQRRAAAAKAREQGLGAEPAREGRAAWDELLAGRGTPPAARAPAARPPPPVVEDEEDDEDEPLARPSTADFGELPSSSVPPLPPGVQDEEDLVEEQVAERERAEFERQQQVAAAEYAASSPYRKKVEPLPASAVAPAPAPAPAPLGPAERWLFPAAAARNRKAALVRAIVLREVLGPPVALRRVEEPWSATG